MQQVTHELPYRATSLRDSYDCVLTRIDFSTNAHFKARHHIVTIGELSLVQEATMRRASQAEDFYVVYSYDTPIAWYAHGRWQIPPVFYSKTTSRHQNLVRKAVS